MSRRTPSYCFHRASGQAVARIDGKDHYLGKHGSPESQAEYNRLIAEWFANGQALPAAASSGLGLTVNELLAAYWKHAEQHYRRTDGNRSGSVRPVSCSSQGRTLDHTHSSALPPPPSMSGAGMGFAVRPFHRLMVVLPTRR